MYAMVHSGWTVRSLEDPAEPAEALPMSSSIDQETRPDLSAMERWTAWVFEILQHAAERAEDTRDRAALAGAAEDAEALRRVLEAAGAGHLDGEHTDGLRSIVELWAANQARYERLAAEVDAEAHHEWMIRSAADRLGPLPMAHA